jgi:hypothetical protein
MFLKLLKGYHCKEIQYFAKKIHTQMCLASLFDQRRKVQNEWNDDDDEQKQIFYEEEKNNLLEKSNQQSKCDNAKPLCKCKHKCAENKPQTTYIIQYEGGVGIISR